MARSRFPRAALLVLTRPPNPDSRGPIGLWRPLGDLRRWARHVALGGSRLVVVRLAVVLGCGGASASVHDESEVVRTRPPALVMVATAESEPRPGAVAPDPEPPRPVARAPVGRFVARRTLTVRPGPSPQHPVRGRIPMGAAFDVFAFASGPGCDDAAYADVGHGGFVCLERARKAPDAVVTHEPKMRGYDGLTPHWYAKAPKGKRPKRWRSLAAFRAGRAHHSTLEPDHDYAFVARRRVGGHKVLVDARNQVVRESDVVVFRPSEFAGRALEVEPVAADHRLAWTLAWPEVSVRAEPSRSAAVVGTVDYHAQVLLEPEPVGSGSGTWYRLPEGGYLRDRELGVWVPPADVPSAVGDQEIWLDVELGEQTLTVMLGREPIFATLVSSGFKSPTPRGLFRIHKKEAVGGMRSNPDDAEVYNVEAVPFVQYFVGSFAVHGAYWHDRFGRRLSHGCVNLSPRDAAYVFSVTSPELGDGWLEGFEAARWLGTTVRIRRGTAQVPDKRGDVRPVFGF